MTANTIYPSSESHSHDSRKHEENGVTQAPPPSTRHTGTFSELKKDIVSLTDPDLLVESWNDLLHSLRLGVDEIRQHGPDIVPDIPFEFLNSSSDLTDNSWKEEVKKRGVVIVRGVVSPQVALDWKKQAREYIRLNPQVTGIPHDRKDIFELYWSTAQVQARSHPNILHTQKSLLEIFHATPTEPISLQTPLSYADRLGFRLPGEAKYVFGPHVDGDPKRLHHPFYRAYYKEILQGRWRAYDPYDIGRRVGRTADPYSGPEHGQCGMLRPWQGLLSLSHIGPNEGTMRTFPLLKESIAYILLRPFFKQIESPASTESWELDLESNNLPGRPMGRRLELTNSSHSHLGLESGGVVSVKQIQPGDMVFWHHDSIHAGEFTHKGNADSSVFYIPSVPMTLPNVEYLLAQREAFTTEGGMPPPDFAGEPGEKSFVGRAQVGEIASDQGLKAMGFKKFTSWEGISKGEAELIENANSLLGFAK